MRTTRSAGLATWPRSIGVVVAIGGFMMALPATPPLAQGAPAVSAGGAAANRSQDAPALDTRTLSCDALKERVQRDGSLYVIGRQGWTETFYAVPQCEFWAKPSFAYVNASDGACGLGFLCQWKPGAGSGR